MAGNIPRGIGAASLEWRPEGASEGFVLDLEPFFAEAHGEESPPGT
jgi:hypothetical protein